MIDALTFVIDIDAVPRFPAGRVVDDVDRRGNPIRGRVKEVKPGNRVAIVSLESGEGNDV